MNQLGTVYATKRRRRNSKSLKPPPKDGITKSNPSKRHRERLNAELDTLASLLPFEASILSKLDKLSILRLSVSYLRTKSYFQVAMYGSKDVSRNHDVTSRNHGEAPCLDAILDSDLILQALNGFLLILASEGEVFFASHTIESYLGFHQSDIVHQSVYELVHSEDREELQRQLMWNSFLPPDGANMTLQEVMQLENCQYLERSFTVRFRCLLDNTSGFLRLDIRGRIKVLHGQNRKSEEPPLALFAVCTPFGPPSLLEVPQKDVMFKSKHKLDMALVSMDQRGKMLLGYSDSELSNKGGYDLVHFDDLAYVANAHQELLKTGASGMIAYRVITKDSQWQWLQTSSRLVYKCSKPDFIICTHRPLMEEEGRDLLGKRTMDFKVSYLDATLSSSSYSADSSVDGYGTGAAGTGGSLSPRTSSHKGRRYKNQLRDILTTCRKRKGALGGEYVDDAGSGAGVGGGYGTVYAPYNPAENGLGPYGHQANLQGLYPSLDNSRFFSAEDYLQYRHLANYYTEYAPPPPAPYPVANGFLDVAGRCLGPPTTAYETKEEKLYPCQLDKYAGNGTPDARLYKQPCYGGSPVTNHNNNHHHHHHQEEASPPPQPPGGATKGGGPKTYSNDTRQTVLMWGSTGVSCRSPPAYGGAEKRGFEAGLPHLKHGGATGELNLSCKWASPSPPKPATPHSSSPHVAARGLATAGYAGSPYGAEQVANELQQQQQQQHRVDNKHDVSPLLSISEVTNALLSHD